MKNNIKTAHKHLYPYLEYDLKFSDGSILSCKNIDYIVKENKIPLLKPISDLLKNVEYFKDYHSESTYLEMFARICDLPFYESGYFSDTITKDVINNVFSIYNRNNYGGNDYSYLKYDANAKSYHCYHREKSVYIPYKMYELLFEHHFDVFGFLEK